MMIEKTSVGIHVYVPWMLSYLCILGNAIPTSSIVYLFGASLSEPQMHEKSVAVCIYLFVCDLAQQ